MSRLDRRLAAGSSVRGLLAGASNGITREKVVDAIEWIRDGKTHRPGPGQGFRSDAHGECFGDAAQLTERLTMECPLWSLTCPARTAPFLSWASRSSSRRRLCRAAGPLTHSQQATGRPPTQPHQHPHRRLHHLRRGSPPGAGRST
jgi:hypothetical protein